MACSFQELVTDIITDNAVCAAIKCGCDTLVIYGCVGANKTLREKAVSKAKLHGLNIFHPPVKLCADNGVTIAAQALCMIKVGREPAKYDLDADASIKLKKLKLTK